MLVSVICPTHSGRDLTKLVKSIANSTYKNVEFVVVDEGLERSEQRNIGIKRAKGHAFLILDSDQYISPKLIKECVDAVILEGYKACYIPEIITTTGFFGYLRNWERQFYTGTPVDCVRFVLKYACPVYDLTLNGPEDSDHDRRVVGEKCVTKNVLYHEDNVSIIDYFKKKAYYSKSMAKFQAKYPDDKILKFVWRCFAVYLEDQKYKKVLMRPDLFICIMIMNLIRGVIYLWNKQK